MSASDADSKRTTTTLSTDDFVNHERAKACLQKLHNTFNEANPLIVSDVLDDKGNQYANLVQKGGGVLGVSLVGYTYILEEMGIRFMRLAGTSAGAINTALMTVIDTKSDAKSLKVLDCICKLNFFNLVDGHPAARWFIKNFITHKDFTKRISKVLFYFFGMLALFFLGDLVLLGLQNKIHTLKYVTTLCFVLTGFSILVLGVVAAYILTLLNRLKTSGFGINPGDYFYDWIKARLIENGVVKVKDLTDKAGAKIPGIRLRTEHPRGVNGLDGDVTFITSELVTENKIEFPEMCYLFRLPEDINNMQPAGFIRASMSIPIFFESYFINDIPCDNPIIRTAWKETFDEDDPPHSTRFVDGGILSNFPINIFYKPEIDRPRLPSFGIDLDDNNPDDSTKNASNWSLFGYFGRMFNTIRFYYDKDFLLKNRMYEKGVGKIKLANYNWLNFFLTNDDKINMFILGAEAATEFLMNFKWEDYKANRVIIQQELKKEKE